MRFFFLSAQKCLPSCVFAHIIGAQQSKDLHWECHIAILHNVWHFLLQRCKGSFCWGRRREPPGFLISKLASSGWYSKGERRNQEKHRESTGYSQSQCRILSSNIIHSSPNDFENLGGSYSLAFHEFVRGNTLFTSSWAPATTVWFLIINMIYI